MENTKQVAMVTKNNEELDISEKKKTSKIVKKDYVLNDLEALKKKLDNAYRKPEIEITTEAIDGSCVTVAVKTSLFEYFKENLVTTLMNDERISKVEPIRKVTASTNHNGDASVEYQLEVDFAIDGNTHKVKLLCFTTTCNILVQNMGGRPEIKPYLQNQFSSKFFASEFIVKFGEAAILKCRDMDDIFIPTLKAELKKCKNYFSKTKRKR